MSNEDIKMSDLNNGDMPEALIAIGDCRTEKDLLVVDHDDLHDDFEFTVAYDGGRDFEMTCFVSKEDAKKLAETILDKLEQAK